MSYMVIHLDGSADAQYPLDQLPDLIRGLEGIDDIESCISLAHESEWCLSFHANGCLLWENAMGDLQDTWHLETVNQEKLLSLWGLLEAGKIDDIQKEAWLKGDPVYGL